MISNLVINLVINSLINLVIYIKQKLNFSFNLLNFFFFWLLSTRGHRARQNSPFHSIYFVSFPSSNPFHVFSHQIYPPSPWPSSFPSAWHRHLHHPFSPRSLLLSFLRIHTNVALHFEVYFPALQFSQSLSRIRFLSCPFLSLLLPISLFSTLQLPFFPPVFPSLPGCCTAIPGFTIPGFYYTCFYYTRLLYCPD